MILVRLAKKKKASASRWARTLPGAAPRCSSELRLSRRCERIVWARSFSYSLCPC